jgi:hypothetical protein
MRHPLLVLNLGVSPPCKYVRALAGGWSSLWAHRSRGRMICQLYTGVYLRGVFRLGSGIAMIQGKARQAHYQHLHLVEVANHAQRLEITDEVQDKVLPAMDSINLSNSLTLAGYRVGLGHSTVGFRQISSLKQTRYTESFGYVWKLAFCIWSQLLASRIHSVKLLTPQMGSRVNHQGLGRRQRGESRDWSTYPPPQTGSRWQR